ncbi:hypothetical protein CDAR_253331 [Caerostris darwini]|uniref:Uncharacterized protein n=1 Tax=Caerostris darwini TaxID=1538125 RepID=A0AAV4U8G6_9ARAC|nr:hypothetical protein CDAR_253331 [Caerostris darwini]
MTLNDSSSNNAAALRESLSQLTPFLLQEARLNCVKQTPRFQIFTVPKHSNNEVTIPTGLPSNDTSSQQTECVSFQWGCPFKKASVGSFSV